MKPTISEVVKLLDCAADLGGGVPIALLPDEYAVVLDHFAAHGHDTGIKANGKRPALTWRGTQIILIDDLGVSDEPS